MKLIDTPSLPKNKVHSVVVSDENESLNKAIHALGIETVSIVKNDNLLHQIQKHSDCMFFHADKYNAYINVGQSNIEEYYSIVDKLTIGESEKKFNLTTINEKVRSPYPDDIKLNAVVIGKNIICNKRHTASQIIDFAASNGYKLIDCKQGYCSCSTAVISDNALMTDDPSIYGLSVANGIDCIELSKGSIKLNGYDYGFIGGCSGMIDKNVIAFTGDIKKHSDYNTIKLFLDKYNVKYVCLTDKDLLDIGGIVPITEND